MSILSTAVSKISKKDNSLCPTFNFGSSMTLSDQLKMKVNRLVIFSLKYHPLECTWRINLKNQSWCCIRLPIWNFKIHMLLLQFRIIKAALFRKFHFFVTRRKEFRVFENHLNTFWFLNLSRRGKLQEMVVYIWLVTKMAVVVNKSKLGGFMLHNKSYKYLMGK